MSISLASVRVLILIVALPVFNLSNVPFVLAHFSPHLEWLEDVASLYTPHFVLSSFYYPDSVVLKTL
jgi:hypothetical protein